MWYNGTIKREKRSAYHGYQHQPYVHHPIALCAGADEDEYQIDIELGPVSLDAAIEEAKELLNRPHITSVLGWDMTTGEILFTAEEEIEDMEELPEEPDWIDDDCGFDPYLGCYTDDC